MLVGLGNALVDIWVKVPMDFLFAEGLDYGGMILAESQQIKKICQKIDTSNKGAGGSIANTLVAFSRLGGQCTMLGCVGEDDLADVFIDSMKSEGVKWHGQLSNIDTGSCLVLVTPDYQRTMVTHLGAALNLTPIPPEKLPESKAILLESYVLDLEQGYRIFQSLGDIYHSRQIFLTLSDKLCIKRHREFLLYFIQKYCTLIFGNIAEWQGLFPKLNNTELFQQLQLLPAICVMTGSEKGSWIIDKDILFVDPPHIEKVVDSTGAGDFYAGGFLHEYMQEKDLLTCGRQGSANAGKVLAVLGTRP